MLEEMKELARQRDLCVLATVSSGNPHCSLMAYATDEDCREIYMVTQKGTKKYENLISNPSVSLLIDTRTEQNTSQPLQARALTIAGIFQEIDDESKRKLVRTRLVERHPYLAGFIDQGDTELICIKATSFLVLNGLQEAHFETV
jgi:nitroimidazol reductase NimA-like FMN-containing flavoprotein (pyridoxamine 5'-phosphate oxidase superfamily)